MSDSKKRVLILCTGNSARSQMAEGLLRHMAGDKYTVYSAGTHPGGVNPFAIKAMAELGINITSHTSKSAQQFVSEPFDYVITVCDSAKENCPVFLSPGRQLHWSFADPASATGTDEEIMATFRIVRDLIQQKFYNFFVKENREQ
jgi:arsenate reductase